MPKRFYIYLTVSICIVFLFFGLAIGYVYAERSIDTGVANDCKRSKTICNLCPS